MRIHDEKLRADRLVFYAQDVARLDGELDAFLELCGARCAMLIDKEGHLVTRRGEPLNSSVESISALIAGSFAATKEMARLLGENEFTALFHQGERDNIQLSLVGDRTLLTILFDDRTTVGMVRLYANETAKKLAEIYTDAMTRTRDNAPELEAGYGNSAKKKLDNLFD